MKKSPKNPRITRVAISVLNYFRDHPDAEDTAVGIAQWWVGEAQGLVEEALYFLMSQGMIEKQDKLFKLKKQNFSTDDYMEFLKITKRWSANQKE